MKLIFSRKGFDSAAGRVANPIFPDGRLCYLPIPGGSERIKYGQVTWDGLNLGDIVEDVTDGVLDPRSPVHLDPDINPSAIKRRPGWRGLFGQCNAAQTHLANSGVSEGDLFLFFGWFREVCPQEDRVVYARNAPDLHVLFGWMQVDSVRRVDDIASNEMPWARYHPHFGRTPNELNTIYVAKKKLEVRGLRRSLPGAGVFATFDERLQLTAPDSSRSRWKLPQWFYPAGNRPPLSYHRKLHQWQRGKDCVYLNTVGRGQEFVLDCDHYPEAFGWVRTIFGCV